MVVSRCVCMFAERVREEELEKEKEREGEKKECE
jgi:hypothetical protein